MGGSATGAGASSIWKSGSSWSSYWAPLKASNYISGDFDFIQNKWLDESSAGNHLLLKGASARTGNGSNLDYTITGVLTTDVITVVSGSDTPTIPANGTLRIGAAQIVYGVTITRSGVLWAIIPFCEPYMNENIPTRSFDVTGNGHHATCATLAAGNITTQNNYFYLQRYGYTLGSEDILGWNLASWSGAYPNENFSGNTLGFTPSADKYITPTPDGLGCRCISTAGAGREIKFWKLTSIVIGKRYRAKYTIENFYAGQGAAGFKQTGIGVTPTIFKWIIGTGNFDFNGVATGTNPLLESSNNACATQIDIKHGEFRLMVVVPARITGNLDALGNAIEYIPDGRTLLNYTCTLQAPAGLLTADQKGYWSDYMNQGYCVNGKTYLIEKTEANHFGVGKVAFNEFVSNGTEILDDNNIVRELILHGAQRGFFFDDDETPHPRGYSDFVNIKTHFIYCNISKTEEYHSYMPAPNTGLLPPQMYDTALYGWKGYIDNNKLTNLSIIKSGVYLTDAQKILINATLTKIEEPTFAMVSFDFDSWTEADYAACIAVFRARKFQCSRALYYTNNVTKAHTDQFLADGGEVFAHTPAFGAPLASYKAFAETELNYTESELRTYFDDVIAYMNSVGYNSEHKIIPGGTASIITQGIVSSYFKSYWLATGSEKVNRTPIVKYNNMGRYGNEFLDAAGVTAAEAAIDSAITNKGWILFYSHTYSHNANTLTNLGTVLDYIVSKIAAGEKIRFCKVADAYNIIKKIK